MSAELKPLQYWSSSCGAAELVLVVVLGGTIVILNVVTRYQKGDKSRRSSTLRLAALSQSLFHSLLLSPSAWLARFP
mgnify:CR=1 FL=1